MGFCLLCAVGAQVIYKRRNEMILRNLVKVYKEHGELGKRVGKCA